MAAVSLTYVSLLLLLTGWISPKTNPVIRGIFYDYNQAGLGKCHPVEFIRIVEIFLYLIIGQSLTIIGPLSGPLTGRPTKETPVLLGGKPLSP